MKTKESNTATLENPADALAVAQRGYERSIWDAHRADMEVRKARPDANREEQLKCLNSAYAAAKEANKPKFQWTVTAEWIGEHDGDNTKISSEQTVVAHNEQDAWAMFCDKLGEWPSPRDTKRTFVKGRQMKASAVPAESDDETEMPRHVIPSIGKRKKTVRL